MATVDTIRHRPDSRGRFGRFGGRFVPETVMAALDELEAAMEQAFADPAWHAERDAFSRDYVGRPTPLYLAERLTEKVGGARIWLKREDLNHTGAHKINNALGQALIARTLGKRRIVAETGAGQHGVATATVCARFGLECDRLHGRGGHRAARSRTSSAWACSAPPSCPSPPAPARSRTP